MENKKVLNQINENGEVILTDEQVDEIVNVLEKERKSILEVPTEEEPYELIEAEADVKVDPKTGTYTVLSEKDNELANKKISDSTITEVVKNINNDDQLEKEYLESMVDNPEEALQLFEVVNRIRSGEKFSVYNALPQTIKNVVDNLNTGSIAMRNEIAKDLMKTFIEGMESEKELIDFNEAFQKEIQETVGDLSELYSTVLEDRCGKLEEVIKELESKGKNEEANTYKELLNAFKDSYSLVRQLDALDNMSGIRKSLRRAATKPGYLDRAIEYFNYKYKLRKNKKLIIKDISNIPVILLRVLSKYVPDRTFTMDDVYQYVMLLCEVCKNYSPDNPVEHQFMYYSVNNIIALDFVEMEKSEINKDLIQNIVKVIDKIHEVIK